MTGDGDFELSFVPDDTNYQTNTFTVPVTTVSYLSLGECASFGAGRGLILSSRGIITDISTVASAPDGCSLLAAPYAGVLYGTGSTVTVCDSSDNPCAQYILSLEGDINGDGAANAVDCMLMQLIINGQYSPESPEDGTGAARRAACDADKNGIADAEDFYLMLNSVVSR